MKKLSAIMIALILVATTAFSAFAAGINSSEQAVLDELSTSVKMSDGEMSIPSAYINQAENYFNTIDMTEDESAEIIAIIKEGKNYLANSGAANILDLTFEQKQTVLAYGKEAVAVIGMTMSFDKTTQTVTVYAPDGTVAFAAKPELTKGGATSNGGSTPGGITENPIKPTGAGFDFAGYIALAGVAVLLVVGGTLYVVKSKKERA